MSRQPRPALRAAVKKHQADPLQDPVGAFLLRQRPELAPGAMEPPHPEHAERITDDAAIGNLLASVSTMADGEDDLLFELLYLETLIAAKPLKSTELLEQLGALGEEVREGLTPPGTINLVALRNRTRRLKQHLGGMAGRVSAAMLMLLTSLPFMGQQAQAAEAKDDAFQIAAATAPVVRVIDANTGVGLAGVTIKSMEEKVLGVTDANGQATLSEDYHNTDLMSLEKSGYELSLLERSQLAARNIISMKPNGAANTAAVPKPNPPAATPNKPMVKPPTAPGPGTGPKVAAAPGQAPHIEAPKPPSAPKAPQIKLPVRPKATSHPVANNKPSTKAAAKPQAKPSSIAATLPVRPKPQQVASNNLSEAPVLPKPHVDMPVAPKAPGAKPMAKPQLPVVHHNDPKAGAARETAMSLPSRPRKPIQTAAKPESSEREPIAISVPKHTPKAQRGGVAAGGGAYRVKPGDSLSKLAQRYLGNANRWPELYAMNRGTVSNPRMIRVGQVLHLPGAGMASGKSRVYVVRPGDSLFKIAGQQMGNGSKWASIYEANKDHIRDARMIFPGQKLVLPV